MPEKPVTTYVVSVFEKPHWRTVLTTKDKEKAFALVREIGDKAHRGDHGEAEAALA